MESEGEQSSVCNTTQDTDVTEPVSGIKNSYSFALDRLLINIQYIQND